MYRKKMIQECLNPIAAGDFNGFKHVTGQVLTSYNICNDSAGTCIYCMYRKKMIQECLNPIAAGDFNGFKHVTGQVLTSYKQMVYLKGFI